MTAGPRQRRLTNRQVHFTDGQLDAKYLFPFWDSSWSVRFVLLDTIGGLGPRRVRRPVTVHAMEVRVEAPLSAAESLDTLRPDEFSALYHFDPWWVFRGMGEVADGYRAAVLPTNIARPFRFAGKEWKVHDVEYGPRLDVVSGLEVKDALFQARVLSKGTFDLDATFGRRTGA